jgi:hypothetical protein
MATLTTAFTKSTYTTDIGLVPMPNHDNCPLSAFYINGEHRYMIKGLVRNASGAFQSPLGVLQFGSGDMNIPSGAEIYIGGVYIAE